MAFTTKDKLDCARRELAIRKRVYPKWIAAGMMSEFDSIREIALMTAIVEDYQAQYDEKQRKINPSLFD